MRLFTGLDLPERATSALGDLLAQLRPLAPLRWSIAANLHITTKFIGEWPAGRLGELRSALEAVPKLGKPVPIALSGLGWFPNPHQPRIFWASVKAPPELAALAAATEEALARGLGIAKEDRPYRPHLTLARVNGPADLGPLRRAVAALPSTEFGGFEAAAFHLYLSEEGRYAKLASYPLAAPEKDELETRERT